MGQLWVVDCAHGKWDAAAVCVALFNLAHKHRPTMVWLEAFPGWDAYGNLFLAFARDHNVPPLPVEWRPTGNKKDAKLIRIGGIKAVLSSGRLWIYGHIKGYAELCTQLLRWPKLGKHDDFADCLGHVCECPTGMAAEKLPAAVTSLSYIHELHKPREESYDSRPCGSY